MDTDGYAGGEHKCANEFSTVSHELSEQFLELCRTLGLKPNCVHKQTTWVHKGERKFSSAYRITFSVANGVQPFRSPRKRAEYYPAFDPKVTYRSIIAITPVPSVPVRCIGVDAPDSLFLAGPGMVPTHNTASLAEGLFTYSVVVDPSDCTLIMPSQDSARDFSKRRLDRLIRNSPEIAARVGTGHDNNVLDKMTVAGAMLTVGWPTVSQLASKNLKRVILSDLDRMPADIGGEGDAFSMARKRTQSFMSAGKVVAESTPGFEVTARDWVPPDPDSHLAPPVSGGVLSLYNTGTCERFYWKCPHCAERFRAEMQHFRWDDLPDPVQAAATAHVVCPECGGVIDESQKSRLNLDGVWLAEGWRTGTPKTSRRRSFWMHGVAAAFQRWSSLAYNMIIARREFEKTGSTEALKTATNVDWGLPFLPPSSTSERSSTVLAAMAENYPLGVVPENGRFLIASVDMQKNRFVLQVVAHGPKNERWVIDRRNIVESPRILGDGSKAKVEPFNYAEDFEALLPILTDLKYPHSVEGDMGIRVLALDTGGVDAASMNAYTFWRKTAKMGLADKVMLIKGYGKPNAKRLTRSTAQKVDAVPLWVVGTNVFKTELSHDLMRQESGAGKIHLSAQLESWFFDELTAEEQEMATGRWVKKHSKARNEAWDLLVYDAAAYVAVGGEGVDWDKPQDLPHWAAQRERIKSVSAPPSLAAPVAPGTVDWEALAKSLNG